MNNENPYYDNDRNPEEHERSVFEKAWDFEDIGKRIRYLQEESERQTQQLYVRIFTRIEIDDCTTKMEMALDELSKVGIRKIDRIIEEFTEIKREQDKQTKINESTIYTSKGLQTKYKPPQLGLIFDALLTAHLKRSDRINFIAIFQDEPLPKGWKKVIWRNSRKRFYYLFNQMTGRKEPSLMNKYFIHQSKIKFISNDAPKNGYNDFDLILNRLNQ